MSNDTVQKLRVLSLIFLTAFSSFASGWKMFDRRIGLFLHWGIYSVNGWHEQEEMRRKVNRMEYEKAMERFIADKFDADPEGIGPFGD